MTGFFKVDEATRFQSSNIFRMYKSPIRSFIIFHLFYRIADEITSNIVQFIRSQVVISAEIIIHIHLKSTIHFYEFQVVLSTCNDNAAFFDFQHIGLVIA